MLGACLLIACSQEHRGPDATASDEQRASDPEAHEAPLEPDAMAARDASLSTPPARAPAHVKPPASRLSTPETYPSDAASEPDSEPEPSTEHPPSCPFEWATADFAVPEDALACQGEKLRRYDAHFGLYVGIVLCPDDALRVYLSRSEAGPFLPALDWSNVGQDHCELVNAELAREWNETIESGTCAGCGASEPIWLEGAAFVRGHGGEPFIYAPVVRSCAAPLWRLAREPGAWLRRPGA